MRPMKLSVSLIAVVVFASGCKEEKVTAPSVIAVKEYLTPGQLELGEPLVNSAGMLLIPIQSGEFLMGSPDSDSTADADEKPQSQQTIAQPFYMGAYEVTRQQYQTVMGIRAFLIDELTNDFPVTDVSYADAQKFCRKLSKQEGEEYRLPTEAEWEYACRAGTTTKYSFGDDPSQLGDYGWFVDESPDFKPHPIGRKQPNPWGLYDMHGNVWEWCRGRVVRGGSWFDNPWHCRSANRSQLSAHGLRDDVRGFRVVRVIPKVAE